MEDLPTLESQLAQRREAAKERFPALVKLIERLTEDLGRSRMADALDVGDQAPDFILSRADTDEPINLAQQLANGPVVLSFYRGRW
jgi:hypothetical protein